MTRVKRSIHARKKRRATLARAKGYRGDASRRYRVAKEAVLRADRYSHRERRRWRERSGLFVAEGEDLLKAADVAGWHSVERFCAAGSGLSGVEVEPALLASASGLGSGVRTLAVYEERWAALPTGPLCLYL